ncbi:MAG: hypothetical protein ABGZ24_05065 [Fuerstiella sp.]
MTDHDELLLQRCVDGEISANQRAELIQRLDANPDGWKVLACSFMEDQLVASGIAHSVTHEHAVSPVPQLLQKKEKPHWFHHPLMSVTLSVCVAFLGGVLISREMSSGVDPQHANAVASPSNQTSESGEGGVSASLVAAQPDYHMRLEADGETSRDLPVYDDTTRFVSEFERYLQQVRQSLRDDAQVLDSPGSRIQWIQLRLDDGRTIMIPFEETPIAPRLQ